MTRLPDPGGVFQFDDERHVLGHLRSPYDDGEGVHDAGEELTLGEICERLVAGGGPHCGMSSSDVNSVLDRLASVGDAQQTGTGWRMTEQGHSKLTGPNAFESPPMTEQQIQALQNAGQIDQEGVRAWEEARDNYERSQH